MTARADPYVVLGVRADASDEEIRSAYRRLVQLHHPDHNNGSAESERRFEEVQDAYAQIRKLRARGAQPRSGAAQSPPPPQPPSDPTLDARLKDMERDLREAHLARERARRAAAEAAAEATPRKRPSDEELGYIKTDDSFSKIFADAGAALSEQLTELFDDAREEIKRRRS
ncbi:MAG TPA: J domain-containing protein [Solirubrobacteraceae bacterium]|nr:J domain-containing protein [Solirubrobacteraceae bacterium]